MHPTHATPIRIRGKKCPPPADTPAQQHPLERPSQPQSHRSPVEIALSARRLEKRRRTIEPQSQLELLPTEILEQIFVYNCNVGLTRASHFIGIKLSGNHVYDAFLARVFVQLEDKITKTKYLVKSFTDRLDNEARVEACTKALQARWLTWKRFTALRSRMIQQEKERLGHIYSADVSQDRRAKDVRALFLCLQGVRIPDKLLRYPLQRSQSQFLGAIQYCGANIDWVNTCSGELAVDLCKHGIRDRNYDLIITILRNFHNMQFVLQDLVAFAIKETDCNICLIRFLVGDKKQDIGIENLAAISKRCDADEKMHEMMFQQSFEEIKKQIYNLAKLSQPMSHGKIRLSKR